MAFYLVSARLKKERKEPLRTILAGGEVDQVKPFGGALSRGLRNARIEPESRVWWEEEDYCRQPLAQERDYLLDDYFQDIQVEPVKQGEGWQEIQHLPPLFPELAGESG